VPVRMEQLDYHCMDFREIRYFTFFENLSRKFKFVQNQTRNEYSDTSANE
jgi:hypothetical protein